MLSKTSPEATLTSDSWRAGGLAGGARERGCFAFSDVRKKPSHTVSVPCVPQIQELSEGEPEEVRRLILDLVDCVGAAQGRRQAAGSVRTEGPPSPPALLRARRVAGGCGSGHPWV